MSLLATFSPYISAMLCLTEDGSTAVIVLNFLQQSSSIFVQSIKQVVEYINELSQKHQLVENTQ